MWRKTISLLVLSCAQPLFGAVTYDQIDRLGGSRSRHVSDESNVIQGVALLLQGFQQFSSPSIAEMLASTDKDGASDYKIPANYQTSLDSLFAVAQSYYPSVQTEHPGWVSGALDWLNVAVDTVIVSGNLATANLVAEWSSIVQPGRDRSHYSLQFAKIENRWCLSDLGPAIQIVRDYLSDMKGELQRRRASIDSKTIPGYDEYSDWVQHTAVNLLIERWFDQGSGIRRFTKPVAESMLGGRVFSCAGNTSSFWYQGDPLIDRTVSVAAVSDHCWQRFVVADQIADYITAKGRQGSGNNIDDFAMPGGLEFRSWGYLYVCDRGNNRIKVIGLEDSYNGHVALEWIVNQTLNDPIDLDVTMDGHLIVAENGSNSIATFCDPTSCQPFRRFTTLNGLAGSMYVINQPVAVSFARNPLSSAKNILMAYLIDRAGSRILQISNPMSVSPTVSTAFNFPDPIATATDVAVDNKGQVWVVDTEKGKMYKFDPQLRLLAIHGGEGDGDGEYLYPYSISFSQAYQYAGEGVYPTPLPAFAEAILTEKWGGTTGVRRLVSGVDILSSGAGYVPRLNTGSPDFLWAQYFTTDYADLTIEYFCNSTRYGIQTNLNQPPGLKNCQWNPTPSAPSGTYEVRITATSIYGTSNTYVSKNWVTVDRGIVNYAPIVTAIVFPDGDSCLIPYVSRPLMAIANDPGKSIAGYAWTCTPSDLGTFSDPSVNPTYFMLNDNVSRYGTRVIYVSAIDNHGQTSAQFHKEVDENIVASWADCPCIHCGDANSDDFVDQSDAVFLIQYIYAGGAAPGTSCGVEYGRGDANGDGYADISDAVFLIDYIFSGGPAPHCVW